MENKKLTLFGWFLMIGVAMIFMQQTKGYSMIYYVLVLILVYLLISNYKTINEKMFKE